MTSAASPAPLASLALVIVLLSACGTTGGTTVSTVSIDLDEQRFEELASERLAPDRVDRIVAGGAGPAYNSNPPTSGPYADAAPPCGIFRDEIPDVYQVASLHRGTVIINYTPALEASEQEALEGVALGIGSDVIVAPRPGLGSPVVVSAWTVLMELDMPDAERIRSFWVAFAQSAPESSHCALTVSPNQEDEGE